MELNGSKYLTNEETAVINAMRMGGKVEVHFFDSTEDAAEKHYEELKDIITQRVNALVSESSSIKFDSYEFKIGGTRNITLWTNKKPPIAVDGMNKIL